MTEDRWPESVDAEVVNRAAQIGFASQILWRNPAYAPCMWMIPALLGPAIALRQVAFDFDAAGLPRAVVAWAYLSERVSIDFASNPGRPFHISEWNEGADLWVMALFASPGSAAPLLRKLLARDWRGAERIRGFGRGTDGRITDLIDRRLRPRNRGLAHG
jgi:hemolysin-activating ACP:hemolysin acyltransferase